MKTLATIMAAGVLLALTAPRAGAEPAFGGNCLSCHSIWQSDVVTIVGADGELDPDESGTGSPDRGLLPYFAAARNEPTVLGVEVGGLSLGDTYAIVLKRLRFPGVEEGRLLEYDADCDWPQWGDQAYYYSDPIVAHRWGVGPGVFDYELTPAADAGFDAYDLVYAVAGKYDADGGLFYSELHFYLQVESLSGDMNCDGSINNADIPAFVLALTNPTGPGGYTETYPSCEIMNGDVDGNGVFNNGDIQAFVALLTGRVSVGPPGDMNGDRRVDSGDIPGFTLALTDPTAHGILYPDYPAELLGDVNEDGRFDNEDIPAFLTLLAGQREDG